MELVSLATIHSVWFDATFHSFIHSTLLLNGCLLLGCSWHLPETGERRRSIYSKDEMTGTGGKRRNRSNKATNMEWIGASFLRKQVKDVVELNVNAWKRSTLTGQRKETLSRNVTFQGRALGLDVTRTSWLQLVTGGRVTGLGTFLDPLWAPG